MKKLVLITIMAIVALATNAMATTQTINFGYDSSAMALAYDLSEAIEAGKNGQKIQLFGHTDTKGSDEYNLNLSSKRAQTVADFLTEYGVPKENITIVALGELSPLSTDAKSRRVEIEFEKQTTIPAVAYTNSNTTPNTPDSNDASLKRDDMQIVKSSVLDFTNILAMTRNDFSNFNFILGSFLLIVSSLVFFNRKRIGALIPTNFPKNTIRGPT